MENILFDLGVIMIGLGLSKLVYWAIKEIRASKS